MGRWRGADVRAAPPTGAALPAAPSVTPQRVGRGAGWGGGGGGTERVYPQAEAQDEHVVVVVVADVAHGRRPATPHRRPAPTTRPRQQSAHLDGGDPRPGAPRRYAPRQHPVGGAAAICAGFTSGGTPGESRRVPRRRLRHRLRAAVPRRVRPTAAETAGATVRPIRVLPALLRSGVNEDRHDVSQTPHGGRSALPTTRCYSLRFCNSRGAAQCQTAILSRFCERRVDTSSSLLRDAKLVYSSDTCLSWEHST